MSDYYALFSRILTGQPKAARQTVYERGRTMLESRLRADNLSDRAIEKELRLFDHAALRFEHQQIDGAEASEPGVSNPDAPASKDIRATRPEEQQASET